jgi:hypothetical protein
MEMLMGVKHLTRKGDYMSSFDMQYGFYALGINAPDRDYFTVKVRGQFNKLTGLPMGRLLSPLYFFKMALNFRELLSRTGPKLPISTQSNCTKTYLRITCWRDAIILPCFGDFQLCSHLPRKRRSPCANA